MSASRFSLTALPVETLEQIFMCLSGQDVIKMKAICRRFRDLAQDSSILQYRRELFAAGLMDNPHNSCSLDERRRLCREYAYKYAANMAKRFREVPLEHRSSTRRAPRLRPTCREPKAAACPPKNILAIAEQEEASIRIRLLNLLNGSPYRTSPPSVITWEPPQGFGSIFPRSLAMSASRLMVDVCNEGKSFVWTVVVWDWETGDLVFDYLSVEETIFPGGNYLITFLDELRIMVACCNNPLVGPELLVFNTLAPQGHPRNLRRFRLPPRYRDWTAHVRLGRDRSLGTVNRDEPLITDPAQAIFTMDLSPNFIQARVLLVLRVQHLIEIACSARTDVQIPWDEWGRGSVVVEIPKSATGHLSVIHGAHLLVMHNTYHTSEHCSLRVFDFSRRGSVALPLSNEGDDGTERRALFGRGHSCTFRRADGMRLWRIESVGDSIVFRIGLPSDNPFGIFRILDLM